MKTQNKATCFRKQSYDKAWAETSKVRSVKRPAKIANTHPPYSGAVLFTKVSLVLRLCSFLLGVFTWRTKIQTKNWTIESSEFLPSWGITAPKNLWSRKFSVPQDSSFCDRRRWISRLLLDTAFSSQPGKLLCGLKTPLIFWDFAI